MFTRYRKNETPMLCATLCYYDNPHTKALGEQVQNILEAYGFFPPHMIFADTLTSCRFRKFSPDMHDLLSRAYMEEGVGGVKLVSGDSRKVQDYWQVEWFFRHYNKKDKLEVKKPKILPWNVLSLYTTYGRIKDEEQLTQYLGCVKELIRLIKPFYADIDDVSNSVRLLKAAREETFNPEYIQQIYWGNYWDLDHYQELDKEKILNVSKCCVDEFGNGVFLTLTDNVFDACTMRSELRRKWVKRKIGLKLGLKQTGKYKGKCWRPRRFPFGHY